MYPHSTRNLKSEINRQLIKFKKWNILRKVYKLIINLSHLHFGCYIIIYLFTKKHTSWQHYLSSHNAVDLFAALLLNNIGYLLTTLLPLHNIACLITAWPNNTAYLMAALLTSKQYSLPPWNTAKLITTQITCLPLDSTNYLSQFNISPDSATYLFTIQITSLYTTYLF